MKLLIHSNAPWCSTGYGIQCRLLTERLVEDGHEVAISCTYGHQGSTRRWKPAHSRHPELWGDGVLCYPQGWEMNSNDVIHNHAAHFFDGDLLGGWIITILDQWCMVSPMLSDFNVLAWTPVDHAPVPPGVLRFFQRSGAVPVAMSVFGERLLTQAGLEAWRVPLVVDTEVFKETPTLTTSGSEVDARKLFGLPAEAFVVGMVAMNKDAGDRKGFSEAFLAFGVFLASHPDAVLFMHTDPNGMGTSFDLRELATYAGIPEQAIVWTDNYAYRIGLPDEMMAAAYTAMDVLLAPSHGEGFCVPLIEAQACGTPVIVSDFSAQSELVGAGWTVLGQHQWDPASHAFYFIPFVHEIVSRLEMAYVADLDAMAEPARAFASLFNADSIFKEYWRPLLGAMDSDPVPPEIDRGPLDKVAVLIPAMRRPENVPRLMGSLAATPEATAYYICDADDVEQIAAVEAAGGSVIEATSGSTFAAKINDGVRATAEPWVFVSGDDVEFTPGWIEAARPLAERFDVIGTNDTARARPKNPDVASGRHADHFFMRRSYIEDVGGCLDGPGVAAPTAYRHWFCDREMVGLAKARGVFSPCLASVVEHHHPGYDNAPRDGIYTLAQESALDDEKIYALRKPLIGMARLSLGRRS